MHILLSFLTTIFIYAVSGFVVFYFGSKPSDRELDRREAIMSGLVLGIAATATAFLGTFYGSALTFFLVVSMLVKVYDCGLVSSFLMTIGAMLLPIAFFMGLRACMGG